MPRSMLLVPGLVLATTVVQAQETRLLREPTVSATHVAFAYGGDLWITGRLGGMPNV